MSIKDWNAGIIRAVPVAPTGGPYGSAPGVWVLDQVAYWTKQGSWPVHPYALFAGGFTAAVTNTISRISFTTTGNSTGFGELYSAQYVIGGAGSTTRAIVSGGIVSNVIQYVSFSSDGVGKYFGDLTVARYYLSCASNSTRMLNAGGFNGPVKTIDYVTMATLGNAAFFGELTLGRGGAAPMASSTRAVFGGGRNAANLPYGNGTNVIDYVTIATTGNAVDFGDATILELQDVGGCSNSTRGLLAGGTEIQSGVPYNVIAYITIATTGNAIDFGDLTVARRFTAGAASSILGVFGGGSNGNIPANFNTIDYVTIATTGNATDFGDLTAATNALAACSNAHGGI